MAHSVLRRRDRLHLVVVLVLLLSLLPMPALTPAILADDPPLVPPPPPSYPETAPEQIDPHLPTILASVRATPDPLAVGMAATFTITLVNEAVDPGEGVVVTVAPPAGAIPAPGPGFVSAADGWRWEVGTLGPRAETSVSGTLTLASAPPGDALLVRAIVTADGLAAPVEAEGGAIIDAELAGVPSSSPTVAARPVTAAVAASGLVVQATPAAATPGSPAAATPSPLASPAPTATATAPPSASPQPSQGPRTARFVPGRSATLTSADGKVTVDVPADAAGMPLTLRHGKTPAHGERGPQGVSVAGMRLGLGGFFLGASDDGGRAVHTFDRPVTLRVRYTPEQLRAHGLDETQLALFTFDETLGDHGRWIAVPSAVDPAAGEVSAQIAHFSAWQLADGTSPATNYLPNLKDWQTDLYTGAATYAMPLELPAGPGGLKPGLTLSYNSQQYDGNPGRREKWRAGWAGRDWSLDTPSIGLIRAPNAEDYAYSLSLDGYTATLMRGNYIGSGNSQTDVPDPTKWEWLPTSENFLRVRAVGNGLSYDSTGGSSNPAGIPGRGARRDGVWLPRVKWQVWTPDNTLHEFAEDLWQGFDNCTTDGDFLLETYKWRLTTITDRHGNRIGYDYNRDGYFVPAGTGPNGDYTCGVHSARLMTATDAAPRTISWGGNIHTGATARYMVKFPYPLVARTADIANNQATNQLGGPSATPRPQGILQWVAVCANTATGSGVQGNCDAGWKTIRRYQFDIDEALQGDNPACPGGANCSRLRLKSVQLVSSDNATSMPRLAFTYGTTVGAADWNRLIQVDNSQGGRVTYTYQAVTPDNGRTNATIFQNRRRVATRVATDLVRNVSGTWTYAYTNPENNTLGWDYYGQTSGPTNETQQYPNSAAIYYNQQSLIGGSQSASRAYLLTQPADEFRGHWQVGVLAPDNSYTLHWFVQGDRNPDNDASAGCQPGAGGSALGNYDNNACFAQLRTNEFLKGRQYRVQVRQGSATGTLYTETTTRYLVGFVNGAGTSNLPYYPGTGSTAFNGYASYWGTAASGVWRHWQAKLRTIERVYEGAGTPAVKTTNHDYNPSGYQTGFYGNPTRTAEYDGDWEANGGVPRVRLRERWYNTLNQAASGANGSGHAYLVTLPQQEKLTGATSGDPLGHTAYYYDANGTGSTVAFGTGATGDLTLVRTFANLATTGDGSDMGYRYDAYGNRTQAITYAGYAGSVTAQAGGGSAARTTTTAYDPNSHVFPVSTTPPDPNGVGLTETATYDETLGTMLTTTDANGVTTSATYDLHGRTATLVKHGDSATHPTTLFQYFDWEYHAGARPVQYRVQRRETAGNSYMRTTLVFYDGLGRQIQTRAVTAGGMAVNAAEFDGAGRAVAQHQPYYYTDGATLWTYAAPPVGNARTTTVYDPLGRPTSITDPVAKVTNYSYARQGTADLVATIRDANNHRTDRVADTFGRLRRVAEFSGNNGTEGPHTLYATTTHAYDGRDLLTGSTDAAGNATTIQYDGQGRKQAMHDPDMGDWSYTYNPDGTLATQTDAKAQQAVFTYDALGRLTQRSTAADGRVLGYSYDANGPSNQGKGRQTGSSVAAGGTTQHTTTTTYDQRGRVATLATWTSALAATRTFAYTYDSADRQATMTYPTGEVLSTFYDAGWRQRRICTSLGPCYAQLGTYNALDEPTSWSYGNGLAQGFAYDTLGRVTSIQVGGGNTLNLGYVYDNVGNVATKTDTLNGQTENFAYDHRDRLTRAWTTGGATAAYDESYQYNAIGNITAKGPTGSLTAYTYNPSGAGSVRPHAVTAVGASAYTYDANGNMTGRAGKALAWNADNTVASVVGPDNVPEGYTYDAAGQRATRSRNLGQIGGVTTVYCGGLYEEDAQTGEKRLLYVFNGRVVAQRTIPAGGGGGTLAYLHADHLGSTGATTSAAGATTATQRHTPFGAVRAGGGLPTTIGFTGQRQDGTGLLFYNARYYDPGIGRFISADIAPPGKENPQARSRYSYVLNNPLKYTDPTGLCTSKTWEEQSGDERTETIECDKYISWLYGWGIETVGRDNWQSYMLEQIWEGVRRMSNMLGWGLDGVLFKAHVLKGVSMTIEKTNDNGEASCGLAGAFACAGWRGMVFTGNAFRPDNPDQWAFDQRTVVHELAHVWDFRSRRELQQGLDRVLADASDRQRDRAGWPKAPEFVPASVEEDFAESVAFYVMESSPAQAQRGFVNSSRWGYVQCIATASPQLYRLCGP